MIPTTALTAPSKRTYAQVVKDTPQRLPPCYYTATEFSPGVVFISHPDREEEWTDISSIASCSWPDSGDDGDDDRSTSTDDRCTPIHNHVHDTQPPPDDVWPDDDHTDTRALRSLASHIKHANRSRWLYTDARFNLGFPADQHVLKLWRRYSGRRSLMDPWERDLARQNIVQAHSALLRELREAIKCRGTE